LWPSGAEAADEARHVEEAAVAVSGRGAAVVEVDEVAVVVVAEVAVDLVLDVDEAVDAAGDGDGALVPEAVLFFFFFFFLTEGSSAASIH
jgi:hypothetical protein